MASSTYGLAELARAAEVSPTTVKYYLREGLLPAGRLRSATRADYDEHHLRRLRLLRVLREVGGVPVERLRALVEVLDAGGDTLAMLGAGAEALLPPGARADDAAAGLCEEVLQAQGWQVAPDSRLGLALRESLSAVLATASAGPGEVREQVLRYARTADRVGAEDVATLDADDPADLLAQMVVGQVVYGRLLEVMRRVAEAHHAGRRWGRP
ncbi:MerR family transcriptional regulator [Nocardioidaceae bacterium]|nr:MerR family transcriptional regulator [Nocardioidaceae bacterium]